MLEINTGKLSSSKSEICTDVIFVGGNGIEECSKEEVCKSISIFLRGRGLYFHLRDSKVKATVDLRSDEYPGRTDLVVEKVILELVPESVETIGGLWRC